jgi:putative transcriptional regulator
VVSKIRVLRKSKGITQKFMADQLGYKYSSGYSHIEMGRKQVSLEQAKVIARVLNVSIDELASD